MKIEPINRNSVKVIMTHADLNKFGLDYEKLGFENIQTKALLYTLLDMAEREYGFERKGKRLSVRTLPIKDGCVIYMTALDEKTRIKSESGPLIFGFSDADALLDAFSALCFAGYERRYRSDLYRSEEGYILTVAAKNGLPSGMAHILGEFSDYKKSGTLEFARIAENCELLAKNDAIMIALGKH